MFKLSLTSNNKIKIEYLGDTPVDVLISPLLSTIRIPMFSFGIKFTCKGHWVIPNLDYQGCSVLKLEFNNQGTEYILPPEISRIPSNKKHNVICLGLNKTGTTSLKAGLEDLGYNVMWESLGHQFIQSDVWRGDYSSLNSIIHNPKFNAYEDIPFSFKGIHQEIYKIDPNAKYILTTRDTPSQWVYSVMNHYGEFLYTNQFKNFSSPQYYKINYSESYKVNTPNFANAMFNSWGIETVKNLGPQLEDVYNSHINEVTKFFKDKNKELLILNVAQPNSFKQMADFLGEKTDKSDFPWLNNSKLK